jgi:hypothetical protein
MPVVFPMRFRTGDRGRREAIVRALRTHGARVAPGPVDDVCELYLDTNEPLAAVRRTLSAVLDRSVSGWRRDATIFWSA